MWCVAYVDGVYVNGYTGLPSSSMGIDWVVLEFLIVCIPDRGCFILPFIVTGKGCKVFCNSSGFMNGIPSNWSLWMVWMNVMMGGQKKDGYMNLS